MGDVDYTKAESAATTLIRRYGRIHVILVAAKVCVIGAMSWKSLQTPGIEPMPHPWQTLQATITPLIPHER